MQTTLVIGALAVLHISTTSVSNPLSIARMARAKIGDFYATLEYLVAETCPRR